ncbi:hypothetical protein QWJ34_03225 [Saccharibacillus sp. CPCC 101409]|uniref:hypothetical protein n=1 Tax=Saccharibacillus sp. CPCC 101409 TaxID=3058041 RepID=UPI0026725AE4|nr:hypothetical protein [Saccharibacillus sp. CPCC 101409]MDO3408769.1 hypothetical protein [Saccharibacillus sp. CPCC 101409]
MKWKKAGLLLLLAGLLALLAGCGKGDDKVLIFMSDKESSSREGIDQIQQKLDAEFTDPKAEFNYSPLFDLQKVMVEYAAGGNSIVILPKDTVQTYGRDGAHLALDEYFDKEKYPEGVFESGVLKDGEDDPVTEEHLFGIPVDQMKMFQDAGYVPKDMLACVVVNAPNADAAIKVLQKLTEG